tara:strand:- start:1416 stop:3956 length:2541 start_codon:yes stop_codon:yes gene_type:complete
MAYIGQQPVVGRYIILDQISGGFNGTTSGFTMSTAAGQQGVNPGLAQNVLLSLGGVIQQPGTDYIVQGSGITFTTPPTSGTTFFATVLGDSQSVGTPSDGTVTPASISENYNFSFSGVTVSNAGELRLEDSDGSNYVGFKSAATVSSNQIWTLPAADGTNGQTLVTDGNGVFSFATAGGGASAINDLSDAVTYDSGVTIGLGTGALANDDGTDNNNTALGYNALNAATSGSENTAVGYNAGDSITTGINNTTVGFIAGEDITTGYRNTAIGCKAGRNITTGGRNTTIGDFCGGNLTTGHSNVVIGQSAGSTLTTGQNNIILGDDADVTAAGVNHEICIGGSSHATFRLPGVQNGASNGDVLTYDSTNDKLVLSTPSSGGASAINDLSDAYTADSGETIGLGTGALANDDGSSNQATALGHNALNAQTTGNRNTAVGHTAIKDLTTGFDNTALGYQTAENITTGYYNVCLGNQAGRNFTTTNQNIAIGFSAASTTNSVARSVAIGSYAGRGPGSDNVVIGHEAKYQQDGFEKCVVIGAQAGYEVDGNENVLIGYRAGYALEDASDNVFIGSRAGTSSINNGGNTFVGAQAGEANTSGYNNVAVGYQSLEANTTGYNNTAVGDIAIKSTTTGVGNTAVGYAALWSNTTGYNSTAMGVDALAAQTTGYDNIAIGNDSLNTLDTGYNNTALGRQAGNSITTGSNNTCIGYDADASSATATNEITLGNSNIATLRCNVQTISSLSDARDKTDIQKLPEGLAFIDSLNPVKFQWQTRDGNGKDGTYEAGFIAQELQLAQQNANADYLDLVMDQNPDRLEASYGKLVPMLVKAVQELSAENQTLKARLDAAGL